MYYTGTKLKCENYNKKVTLGEGYSGSTTKWADIVTHKDGNRFAIIKHENYSDEMDSIVLTEDWFESLETE